MKPIYSILDHLDPIIFVEYKNKPERKILIKGETII